MYCHCQYIFMHCHCQYICTVTVSTYVLPLITHSEESYFPHCLGYSESLRSLGGLSDPKHVELIKCRHQDSTLKSRSLISVILRFNAIIRLMSVPVQDGIGLAAASNIRSSYSRVHETQHVPVLVVRIPLRTPSLLNSTPHRPVHAQSFMSSDTILEDTQDRVAK